MFWARTVPGTEVVSSPYLSDAYFVHRDIQYVRAPFNKKADSSA